MYNINNIYLPIPPVLIAKRMRVLRIHTPLSYSFNLAEHCKVYYSVVGYNVHHST